MPLPQGAGWEILRDGHGFSLRLTRADGATAGMRALTTAQVVAIIQAATRFPPAENMVSPLSTARVLALIDAPSAGPLQPAAQGATKIGPDEVAGGQLQSHQAAPPEHHGTAPPVFGPAAYAAAQHNPAQRRQDLPPAPRNLRARPVQLTIGISRLLPFALFLLLVIAAML